ncbi:PAS domain S-box-containing protein/diguanylate cyclase (GGDEF) domain-containing protein [Blastococcus aggregatus]|uniref:PAS domain S-box-containing protein/diguanylate cyclase (GGDEF) domain-containing protein n=1 Tax=Blastococcus aggregatus TaxID=38502 RepID=A0A285V8Y0_9ACTN|nr:EAL domain-containing protein [Blastococcus aggregatus]SOC50529.1 PAS domain S-box-containing protein/diguanylate cyclase (GGDEF) domain-containing protein [Blastococcus aggregatus]
MEHGATGRRRLLPYAAWAAAASVLLAGYGAIAGTLAAQVVYLVVVWTAAAMAWWWLRRATERLAAVLIAVGLTLSSLGDLIWQWLVWVGREPDVSVADLAYLAGYAALGLGLTVLARKADQPGRQRIDSWIDATVVFVAALLLMWHLSIAETVGDDSVSLGIRAVWTLYPALDAALIALVFRLVMAGGRTDRRALALAGGAMCWLVSDLGYLVASDQASTTGLLDGGWMLGAVLLAVAVQPGRSTAPVEATAVRGDGIGRLAVSLGALLVPGSLELVNDLTDAPESPLAMYAATFALVALVFARTVRLLQAEGRARETVRSRARHSAALAAHSSDAVIVVDRSGRLRSDTSRLAGLLGSAHAGDGGLADLLASTGLRMEEARVVFERVLAAGGSVVSAELPRQVDGQELWLGVRLVDLTDDPDVRGIVVHATDITERKRAEQTLAHQAFHDGLTGLANRALFADRVEQALRHNARRGDAAAVVFIDLDGFKHVNDTLGHHAGDVLLQQVAERLSSAVRTGDTLARLGGDEFAILVEQITGPDEARAAGDRVLTALSGPVRIGNQVVAVSGSVGVSISDDDASSDSLVRDADIAMYAAKSAGRGRVVVFDPSMRAAVVERRELERELQGALAGGQLRLVYQPVVGLAGSTVVGFEALLRWSSPTLGPISPDRFVPVAEDLDLIGEIGAWVLREACATAAEWRRRSGGSELTMAVNVSAVQLASPDLVGQITEALAASGLPASALILEVTETALVRDPDGAAERLAALRALGVRLALDDFGTGYSSLSYLRQFTVDVLKIDRSFISTIQSDELPPIVRGLIDLGRTLDLEIVAEGVETAVQRDQLAAARCELAQGYLFAPPLEADEAARLLLGSPPLAAAAR